MSGEQDIRKMGGLEKHLPRTHITFLVGTLAISGIIPLSGFFSKDEILWAAFNRSIVLWAAGAFTAALTAFYMARLYTLVFLGKGRFQEIPERIAENAGALYRLIVNKYFVDELYARVILAPYDALCRAASWFDRWIVDGLVNAAAYITLAGSYTSIGFDTYVVDGLVNLAGYTVRGASWVFRRLQTGVVQSYATAMILGIFVLVSVYLLSGP